MNFIRFRSVMIYAWILFLASSGIFSYSCKNDVEKLNVFKDTVFPDLSGQDVEIYYYDSSKLKAKTLTPQYFQFDLPEDPYTEFPKGGTVYFYNAEREVSSRISAHAATYFQEQGLWEASDDVEVVNDKGEVLNTEHLFWDQEKGEIYSDVFTKIKTEDGTFYGNEGFVSNENMTNWRLKGSKGKVNVKEKDTTDVNK